MVFKSLKKFARIIFYLFLFAAVSPNLHSKGFFYEVSKNASKVYLLGSIHIAKREAYPLDSVVENSFRSCKNVVLEINLSKLNPFEILQYGTFQDTMTLEKSIPEKYFKIIDSLFTSFGLPRIFYNKLQPWMAVLLIMSMDIYKNSGEYIEGIDLYFANKLDSTQKMLELESFVEQLEVFKKLYELSPEYFMEYFLIQEREKTKNVEDLFSAWLKGDDRKIVEEITPNKDASELERKFLEILNDDRNLKMARKIEEFLSTDDCYFIIVGSAHLFGERGILNLLKDKGFTIRKL